MMSKCIKPDFSSARWVSWLAQQRLTGYVMTEMNYGHRHGQEHPTLTDFPHILANATLTLGKGWSAVAEVEYERFHSEGAWGNNFDDNYTTNKLYINKQWSEALNVKAGIIDIPVGTTNAGGPALTIYDPLSESTLMPMTWHEGGIALWGRTGIVHFELGTYVYPTTPLKHSRLLGAATRVGIEPINGLDLSLSGFYGSAKEGMDQRDNPNLMDYEAGSRLRPRHLSGPPLLLDHPFRTLRRLFPRRQRLLQ